MTTEQDRRTATEDHSGIATEQHRRTATEDHTGIATEQHRRTLHNFVSFHSVFFSVRLWPFFSVFLWLLLCGVLSSATATVAQEWNQWRGPARDGSVTAAGTPNAWPSAWRRLWRTDVGEGYSSPVVAGGRVFVHSRRDPEELVSAIDIVSGKVRWQQKYATPFNKNQYAVQMARGPHATPLVVGNRVITLGAMGVLSAWNTQTGARLWRKDFSADVDTSKLFTGTAASPLAEGGSVIVQVGSDVHGGRVIALDPQTGTERWTWRGKGPGYASPVAYTIGGVRQIVTLTEGSIEGIDAKSGAALWSIPFPDEWHENIVTPVWTGAHLVMSGPRQGTHAYAFSHERGTSHVVEAWKNADVTMYMSTPVAADGVLYGLSSKRKGQIVALDAATGAVRWSTDGRTGNHASILLTPRHVLFLTNDGDLVVARRSADGFSEERRYDVAESETWAVPVLLGDGLIVRDATAVMRLTNQ
jgi:outer membrane protein assembly factor BamB